MKFLIAYLLLTNLFVLFIYGWDKMAAKMHHWRIPESILILLAIPGGACGALLGMLLFHHKTRKPKFTITIPLLVILEVLATVFLVRTFGGVLL